MSSPTVTEVSRLSAHRREVALVRQSLLAAPSAPQPQAAVSRFPR